MLINRRKSDFFIKTSVGGVAKQPVFSSLYFDEPKKCGAFFFNGSSILGRGPPRWVGRTQRSAAAGRGSSLLNPTYFLPPLLFFFLGARRSLRSLHEFSFAHQRVSILLRKNKKTRAVGLFAIALSIQPPHFVAVAAFVVATIPSALVTLCYLTKEYDIKSN